ncbi:MAG: hypothetical protein IKS48_07495 [Eubacterium sp.]|nr:hypothetical protein [Eubacterium sp.]
MKELDLRFRPVILGSDITAYSIARSFHEEYGIRPLTIGMSDSGYVANSSFIETFTRHGMDDPEVALDMLKEVGEKYSSDMQLILFGCGDWYVRIIIENKARLSEYYTIPYIDKELFDKIVDKNNFYSLCDYLGLDFPKTYVYKCDRANSQNEASSELKLILNSPYNKDITLDTLPDLEYPVIAKPSDSALYHYTEFEDKKKVYKCDSKEELVNVLKAVDASGYDQSFLIQDMIPGDDTNLRVLTCYCDRNHKMRFAALGRTLIEDPTPTAIGNSVAIINEVNTEIIESARRFLEFVGYTGFASFDLKYDSRDKKYKFFEINVRLGRSNFYVTGSGFSYVKWIVDEYVYHKLPDCEVADKECLYSVVPMQVIKKYVPEGELKKRALQLWKKGKLVRPLFYKGEKSIMSKYYAYMNYFHYIAKFRRYS